MIRYILLSESRHEGWYASIITLKEARSLLKEIGETYCIFKINVKDPQNFTLMFHDPPYSYITTHMINNYVPVDFNECHYILRVEKIRPLPGEDDKTPDDNLKVTYEGLPHV